MRFPLPKSGLILVALAILLTRATTAQAQHQPTTFTYPLLEGWNLVHFPFTPDRFTTASGLVKTIAQDGGYVTTVATWIHGGWQEYVQRGSDVYSADFAIVPGRAYFLRSHRQINWQVTGTPAAPAPFRLDPGWNSVGLFLTQGQTAADVLSTINNLKITKTLPSAKLAPENATEIDWWRSGNWEVFVSRIFSADNTQVYGDNFTISPQAGYMIKAKDYINVNLTD